MASSSPLSRCHLTASAPLSFILLAECPGLLEFTSLFYGRGQAWMLGSYVTLELLWLMKTLSLYQCSPLLLWEDLHPQHLLQDDPMQPLQSFSWLNAQSIISMTGTTVRNNSLTQLFIGGVYIVCGSAHLLYNALHCLKDALSVYAFPLLIKCLWNGFPCHHAFPYPSPSKSGIFGFCQALDALLYQWILLYSYTYSGTLVKPTTFCHCIHSDSELAWFLWLNYNEAC